MTVRRLVELRDRSQAPEIGVSGKVVLVYEGEAAALERAKALRAEGLGFDLIAAQLNEEHIPTRTGRPWHGVVINRIL